MLKARFLPSFVFFTRFRFDQFKIKNFEIEILFKKEFSQIDLSWSNGQNFKEDTNLVSPIFFLFDFPN